MATAALREIGIFEDLDSVIAQVSVGEQQPKEGLDSESDDYLKLKKLENELDHLQVMEDYVKLETRNLEKELLHAQEEVWYSIVTNYYRFMLSVICFLFFFPRACLQVKRIQSVPLVIGQFLEAVDQDHAI
ncbi:unnamed protein product, partial [Strongylus vulgaris]